MKNLIHVFQVDYSYRPGNKEGYRRNGSTLVLTTSAGRAVRLVEEQKEGQDLNIWQVTHKGVRSQVLVDPEVME
jgi:hypothetical protein